MLSPSAPQGLVEGSFLPQDPAGQGACEPHALGKGVRFVQAAGASGKDVALPVRGHMPGWLGGAAAR